MDIRKSEIVLDPSVVPNDVTFRFKQGDTQATVGAHKVIIAMGSPVFAKQFYGKLKETKEEIDIEETTQQSFKTMIDYIYGKTMDWKSLTVEQVFAIGNLAERYQVDELMKKVKEVAMVFPVVDSNDAVAIASTAREFSQFEGLRDVFLTRCSNFLKLTLKRSQDFVEFADKFADTDKCETVVKLIAMMKGENVEVKDCGGKESCRRGKPILQIFDISVGDRVTINPQLGSFVKYGQEGIVRKISISSTSCRDMVEVDLDGYAGSQSQFYYLSFMGTPAFLFCKC